MSSLNSLTNLGIFGRLFARIIGIETDDQTRGQINLRNWRVYATSGAAVIIALLLAFKFFKPMWWDVWAWSSIFWLSILLIFLSSTAFQIGRSSRGIIFAAIAIAMSGWYIYKHPFKVWNFKASGNGESFPFTENNYHRVIKVIPEPGCKVLVKGPNVTWAVWVDQIEEDPKYKIISGDPTMSGTGDYTIKTISGGEQNITVQSWEGDLK